MKIYANINNAGVVTSLLQTSVEVLAPTMIEVPEYDETLLGKLYDDGDFINAQEPAPLTWANAPAEYFHIEVGAFYDRFGAAKIPVLASSDATAQALVRDTQVRKYIDLKRPDVQQFVGYLATVVPEVTQAVQADVLLEPTTDEERYVKGLPQPVAET